MPKTLKIWKSKKVHPPGVWGSEINLRDCGTARKAKVDKLLKLLEKEGLNALLP